MLTRAQHARTGPRAWGGWHVERQGLGSHKVGGTTAAFVALPPPLVVERSETGGEAEGGKHQNSADFGPFWSGFSPKTLQNFRPPSAAKSQRSETRGEAEGGGAAEYH